MAIRIWRWYFNATANRLRIRAISAKSVQAQDDYVVPEHLSEQLGQQNLGLKHSELYTFTELLQLLIFTQAADVKDTLSNMLCGTDEQAYLILSKRAVTYNLNLKKEVHKTS